jgi:hypothetical protein
LSTGLLKEKILKVKKSFFHHCSPKFGCLFLIDHHSTCTCSLHFSIVKLNNKGESEEISVAVRFVNELEKNKLQPLNVQSFYAHFI